MNSSFQTPAPQRSISTPATPMRGGGTPPTIMADGTGRSSRVLGVQPRCLNFDGVGNTDGDNLSTFMERANREWAEAVEADNRLAQQRSQSN